MKYIETKMIEVKVLDDGAVMVRRRDGRPVTHDDMKAGLHLADSAPGITEHDVLRVFGGGTAIRQKKDAA